MKDWFPFTSYDFYAYLSAGIFLILAFDIYYTGGSFTFYAEWNFFRSIILVAGGYIVGQVIAIPSQVLLEDFLARTVIKSPTAALLSKKKPLPAWILCWAGRYYKPFPSQLQKKIIDKASKELSIKLGDARQHEDDIFLHAFEIARKNPDIAQRMDDFRNQYGFARNMCFTFLVATPLLYAQNTLEFKYIWVISGILAAGMFLRFLKFYSTFAAEVLRNFAYSKV